MKACVSLLVAMLCGLAWAGKSFSGGHGCRMGCLKARGLGRLTEVKCCPHPPDHFDLSLVEVTGSVSLRLAGDVRNCRAEAWGRGGGGGIRATITRITRLHTWPSFSFPGATAWCKREGGC